MSFILSHGRKFVQDCLVLVKVNQFLYVGIIRRRCGCFFEIVLRKADVFQRLCRDFLHLGHEGIVGFESRIIDFLSADIIPILFEFFPDSVESSCQISSKRQPYYN